jgi:predicted branched-subunit amino acid permease
MHVPDLKRLKPLFMALIIAGLAFGVYAAEAVFGEPAVSDCCMAE